MRTTGLLPVIAGFFIIPLTTIYARTSYDMTVVKDGSGTHTTVQAAFNAVPQNSAARTVIYIKNGTYKENLTLESSRKNVTIIGQSRDNVRLTYDNYASRINPATGQEYGTSGSSSTFLNATGFCALDVTFENSAGPVGQAVAVRITGDRTIFYNCRFLGRQDTWYGIGCRILVRKCYLEGTTDFMFGSSTTWFDSCTIYSYGGTALTAASTEQYVAYGYVFRSCTISGASGVSTALGRPWRPYSAVSFLNCSMTSCIKPAGWDNWGDPANEATARYAEYKNTGAGAGVSGRVSWAKQLTDAQASSYTIANVFKTTYANPPITDNWDPLATLGLYLTPPVGTSQGDTRRVWEGAFSVKNGAIPGMLILSGVPHDMPVSVTIQTLDGRIICRSRMTGRATMSIRLPKQIRGTCLVGVEARGRVITRKIPLL